MKDDGRDATVPQLDSLRLTAVSQRLAKLPKRNDCRRISWGSGIDASGLVGLNVSIVWVGQLYGLLAELDEVPSFALVLTAPVSTVNVPQAAEEYFTRTQVFPKR
jgi:hypothetical protein